ncbi:MAG: hypothetical protein AB7F29_13715 [Candidatus Nitrosocosmicus sp.]
MTIDVAAKASELLEALGNSIYDREGHKGIVFTFTIKEIHIVESWLKDLLREAIQDIREH